VLHSVFSTHILADLHEPIHRRLRHH
jgi:hypothetical protein